jgi:hypothetical protein
MNVIETIQEQLADTSAGKLGSLIGEGEGKIKAVLTAAVPALLSALSGLANTSDGAEKLAATVSKFEPDLPARLNDMTRNEADAVQDEGNAALDSLFGRGTVYALAGAIARYTDMNVDKVKTLLGYLGPLVMGALRGQAKGPGAAGLTGLIADQKANLSAAMPAGLSLDQQPGIGKAAPTAGSSSSFMGVLVIVLVLAAIGAGAWYAFQPGGPLAPKDRPATEQGTVK